MWYLLINPGSVSTTPSIVFMNSVSWMQKSTSLSPTPRHIRELSLFYSCRDWDWTRQQISHETSAGGPSSSTSVPTCGGSSGNDQESACGICLDLLSDIQLLLTYLDPAHKTTASSALGQLQAAPGCWNKTVPLMLWRRARFHFDEVVFDAP